MIPFAGKKVSLAALAMVWAACQTQHAPTVAHRAKTLEVHVEKVQVKTFRMTRVGLGSSIALNTTMVRPLVDGRLQKIFFQEGGEVAQGTLLATLDLRPFQFAERQAAATLARDKALLLNA